MGEEERVEGTEGSVPEWEVGLPTAYDLTPLSQVLIPPELAASFRIMAEPIRTVFDVHRASQNTLTSLRASATDGRFSFKSFHGNSKPKVRDSAMVESGSEVQDLTYDGSEPDKRMVELEEADSAMPSATIENFTGDQSGPAKSLKRQRLVWTSKLHKRFLDVVAHLGIQKAVPKTIMQLMNVDGLTRENVASHLQKYRLYNKRMKESPSASDHLFTFPKQGLNESSSAGAAVGHSNANFNGNYSTCGGNDGCGGGSNGSHVGMPIPIPMQYPPPWQLMSMRTMMGMPANMNALGGFHGFEAYSHPHHHSYQQQYSIVQQQRDWSGEAHNGHPQYVTPRDK